MATSDRAHIERDFGEWTYLSEESEACDVWAIGSNDQLMLVSPAKDSGDGGWSFDNDGPLSDLCVTSDYLRSALEIMATWERP